MKTTRLLQTAGLPGSADERNMKRNSRDFALTSVRRKSYYTSITTAVVNPSGLEWLSRTEDYSNKYEFKSWLARRSDRISCELHYNHSQMSPFVRPLSG